MANGNRLQDFKNGAKARVHNPVPFKGKVVLSSPPFWSRNTRRQKQTIQNAREEGTAQDIANSEDADESKLTRAVVMT